MIQNFEIGDKVKVVGEEKTHVIKEIECHTRPIGWHAIVRFTDGGCGIVDSSGFTDLIKIEK